MTIEFTLTPEQSRAIPEPESGQALLVGSIQRRTMPHPDAGKHYFRGRWLGAAQAARLRKAATKLKSKSAKP